MAKAGDALRQLTGASWLRAYGLGAAVAADAEGYVALASGLASDRARLSDLRARCAAAARRDPPPHDDVAGFGAAYGATLTALAAQAGLLPTDPVAETPAAPAIAVRRAGRARRFAILASPRTGSTMLCAMLNRAPGIRCHFELFHAEMIQYRDRSVDDADAIAARDADRWPSWKGSTGTRPRIWWASSISRI